MSTLYGRRSKQSFWLRWQRAGAYSFFALLATGLWRAVRPWVVYELACANLGNRQYDPLIDRAIVARHPEIKWGAVGDERYCDFQMGLGFLPTSSSTGRVAGAVCVVQQYHAFTTCHFLIVNDKLDTLGLVRAANLLAQHDDRDDDGAMDFLTCNIVSAGRDWASYYSIFKLGAEAHTFSAVVRMSHRGLWGAWAQPVWTNSDGDGHDELEWINQSGWGNAAPSASLFKLRWLGPGRMTYDGQLPPDVSVWLADDTHNATFSPDETVDDVARRLFPDDGGDTTRGQIR